MLTDPRREVSQEAVVWVREANKLDATVSERRNRCVIHIISPLNIAYSFQNSKHSEQELNAKTEKLDVTQHEVIVAQK